MTALLFLFLMAKSRNRLEPQQDDSVSDAEPASVVDRDDYPFKSDLKQPTRVEPDEDAVSSFANKPNATLLDNKNHSFGGSSSEEESLESDPKFSLMVQSLPAYLNNEKTAVKVATRSNGAHIRRYEMGTAYSKANGSARSVSSLVPQTPEILVPIIRNNSTDDTDATLTTIITESHSLSGSMDVPVLPRKFNTEQKLTLICLSLMEFFAFLSMSIMAPFFPLEASLKGMSPTASGFVFSVYALVLMIFCPIFGKIIPFVGPRFVLMAGLFACGWTNILFGLLVWIEDTQDFTIMCFTVRIFEALGSAAYSVSFEFIL